MRRLLLAGAGALALMCAPSAASALVIWESTFDGEAVPLGTFVLVPTADGWTADTGVIELQNNVAGEPSTGADGDIFVELDSAGNSSMVRSIAAAGTYTLSWLYSPRPNVAAGSNGISVFLDGVLLDPPGDIAQPGGPQTDWQLFSTTFTANAGSVIRFAATGTSNSLGGYVDNIALSTTVPEPATWAMMITGFAGMGVLARSRRRALSRA